MTILPKKKQSKDKSETDSSDNPHSPASDNGGRGILARNRGTSPGTQRWASPPPIDHLESETTSTHVVNNKRRMRSPPHRAIRKQRHDCQPTRTATMATNSLNRARFTMPGSTASTSFAKSEEEKTAYNSEDEMEKPVDPSQIEKEKEFEMMLKEKKGFIIKRMGEDGACLFRAVADQVYGDQEMHNIIRQNCVDYMAKNMEFFKQFVTEEFATYLTRKRLEHCHGNHVEMQALCEMYNRPIEVYQNNLDPINTFHSSYTTDNAPIRLSYHRNIHYNSIVDPYKATIGVGLGLPEHQPGMADRNLVKDAVRQSEDCHIEQTMLEDKLKETDWELTEETIGEQVARESYLQWLRDQEKQAKNRHSPRNNTAASSSCTTDSNWWDAIVSPNSSRASPKYSTNFAVGGSSPKTCIDSESKIDFSGGSSISPPVHCSDIFDLESNRDPFCNHKDKNSATKEHNLTPKLSDICIANLSPKESNANSHSFEGDNLVLPCKVIPDNTQANNVGFGNSTASTIIEDIDQHIFGFSEYADEDSILAQVLAQSQQEYFELLKKNPIASISVNQETRTSPPNSPPLPPLDS